MNLLLILAIIKTNKSDFILAFHDRFKKIIPVLFGNSLEAYDLSLYGFLAPVFAKVFFPPDFENSLIAAFFIFAVAYVARPFGAIFWGHIADKHGRKIVLVSTLSLMAIPALIMAVIPPYEVIGISACFIIIFLRLMQGFAFSGEFSTAMVVLYESAPSKNKAFYVSFSDCVALIGKLTCIILMILLSHFLLTNEQFVNFGWRILFGVSIVFIILVAYIRKNLLETLDKNKSRFSAMPLMQVLKRWKSLLLMVLFMFTANVLFFSYFYHLPVYIQQHVQNFSGLTASISNCFMIIYVILLMPTCGLLFDFYGRIQSLKILLILLLLSSFLIYFFIINGSFLIFVLGTIFLGFFVASIVALSLWFIVENSHRYSRVSMTGITHGFGIMLFGATTPMINEFLIKTLDTNYAPAILLSVASICSLLSLFCLNMKEVS